MAHPIYTEEERIAARRATWRKYNHAHKAERAAHNKEYVQKEDVKARRRQMRTQSTVPRRQESEPAREDSRDPGGSPGIQGGVQGDSG